MPYADLERRRECSRISAAKLAHTTERKEAQKRYWNSGKGKLVQDRYLESEKGRTKRKEIRRRYNKSKQGKIARRRARHSENGKAWWEKFGPKYYAKYRALLVEQWCNKCDGKEYSLVENFGPNARCFYCGGIAETIDHIIPLSIGKLFPGSKHPNYPDGLHCSCAEVGSNFAPACTACNLSKGGSNRTNPIFPDTPEYEGWIHQQKLRRRRELRAEKKLARSPA